MRFLISGVFGKGRALFPVMAAVWLGFFARMASAAPAPIPPGDPPPLPQKPIGVTVDLPSSEVLTLLQRIEARHGKLKSLLVEFEQSRVSKDFDYETRAKGKLWLKMPGNLRCDQDRLDSSTAPLDPSTMLFTEDTFYYYVPSLKQVDKYTYSTKEQAREFFKTLLLGFGLSSQEILESYQVKPAPASLDAATSGTEGLVFTPIREDVARDYSAITVWFSKKDLLPKVVLLRQPSGDDTTLKVRKVVLDSAEVKDDMFRPVFPKGTDTIEH